MADKDVAKLNREVDRFNLVVPMMRAQMFHFRLDLEAKRILEEALPPLQEGPKTSEVSKITQKVKRERGVLADMIDNLAKFLARRQDQERN